MTPNLRAPKARLWRPKIDLVPTDERPDASAQTPDELVTLFSGEVWRFVSAQIRRREDAEDAVMETFGAAFRDFGALTRAEDQRRWLLGVARKKTADILRRRYRRAERPLMESDVAADGMPTASELAARGAISALPDGQREVITLKYVNGLSIEEIGRVIRRSPAATNGLLQRGRESLRESLGLDPLEKTR